MITERIADKVRYFIKTEKELHLDAQKKLKEEGFNTEKGSIANLFSNIILSIISKMYDALRELHLKHFVSTAEGIYLDDIASRKGITRNNGDNDEKLRYKIVNADRINASCNFVSIKQEILDNFEDVYDVKKVDFTQGAGSCSIYVHANSNNPHTLELIKNKVAYKLPSGIATRILYPKVEAIGFTIKINSNSNTESENIDVRRNIIRNLEKALSSLRPNENLNSYDIMHIINTSDETIKGCSIIDYTVNGEHKKLSQIQCTSDKRLALTKDTNLIF